MRVSMYILKNVGNQTGESSHCLVFVPTMEVKYCQLAEFKHSSKYLLFGSIEERNSFLNNMSNDDNFNIG